MTNKSDVLRQIREALQAANDDENGPITDTIWMPGVGCQTLFDFIDAAIENERAAIQPASPPALAVQQAHDLLSKYCVADLSNGMPATLTERIEELYSWYANIVNDTEPVAIQPSGDAVRHFIHYPSGHMEETAASVELQVQAGFNDSMNLVQRFADVRDAALEEAAELLNLKYNWANARAPVGEAIAAIRALKSTPTAPAQPCHYKDSDNSETWNEAARQVRATMQPAADILNQPAQPLNASEKCSPTSTQCPRCNNGISACDQAFAAPAQELSALPGKLLALEIHEIWSAVNLAHQGEHAPFVTFARAIEAAVRGQQGGSDAARDVMAERQRQVSVEGWTPEHDDGHGECSMSYAAACYTLHDTPAERTGTVNNEELWQWTGWSLSEWWKPKDRRRNLVRAGALILAEIERLDRAAIQAQAGEGEKS